MVERDTTTGLSTGSIMHPQRMPMGLVSSCNIWVLSVCSGGKQVYGQWSH